MFDDETHRRLVARIEALRDARGWSTRKLADFAGVSDSYLGQVLRRESSPTVDFLAKLAAALEVTVADLLRE